jgi:hypothetical protein
MRSGKIIKKILQITAVLLFLVFAIPATAYLLMQSKRIQTGLVNKVMQIVSDNLKTRFTIGRIDIAFLYRVRLNEVYLEDLTGDTLIYIPSLTVGIRKINPVNHEIAIGGINLEDPLIALSIDSSKTLNLQYFIDKLKGDGQGKGGWKVKFSNIRMKNGRFRLQNYNPVTVEHGVNFSDMRISGINAEVRQFKPDPDSLSFFVKSFQFTEQSGFRLENLTGRFSESKSFLSFREISFKTPYTYVKGDEISLHFKNWGQFKADSFVHFVKLRLNLSSSSINFSDIGYFTPAFWNIQQVVAFSGQVKGPVSNLKGKDLEIKLGSGSEIRGELNFEGLPEFRSTFIYANIKQLTTSASDLKSLQLPGNHSIKVPEQLGKFGRISYHGKFTGFFDDFVAFGKFETGLGNINTDLLFRPDTANYVDFEGKLTASGFDLGTLLDASNNMGKISLTASVNGSSSAGKSINADLKGQIQRFEFRKYEYTNVTISGNLKNKTYNGSVQIKDPNVELEFLGKVNLSDTIATFDFTANVTDANLYSLNIDRSDPDFMVSFYLIAKGHGNSINTLNGEVKLLNSLFTKKDKQLQIYDFRILASDQDGNHHLQLRSDFIDADLSGKYEITEVNKSFRHFLRSYLPALLDSGTFNPENLNSQFNLKASIKSARPLFEFFLPDYFISDKSNLQCSYSSNDKALKLNFQSPQFSAKGLTWNGFVLSVTSDSKSLGIEAGGSNISLGKNIRLDNFTITSSSAEDSSDFHVRWNNWQDKQNKGDIRTLARFSRLPMQKHPHVAFELFRTSVIANDSMWTINPGKFEIDSTHMVLSDLRVSHGNQYFSLEGIISELPGEKINLAFNHFNLANLNSVTQTSGFKLGGILNGEASVSNVYQNPLFTSQMNIDSLMVNNEMLGASAISSSWDDKRKVVNVEAHTMRDNLKTFDIRGSYAPAGKGKLDFDLELNKLRLNIFNPYVKGIFSDLRGMASGKASLSGSISKPLLNGEINLQKSAFTVNYLKTRYNFTEKVQIDNNNIYFNEVRIFDPKGNSAFLTGAIRNKYLKDFQLDLSIRSEDFLCLNTTQADNKMFYGTAYATGVIKMSGPIKNITMDIQATTVKNTSIKIPLSNEGKLNEYNFITILRKDTTGNTEVPETNYQVNLSGMQINFDLTVTPEAEVQIIFDPKLGDIIRGKGSGNLDMKISTNGNFLMYGEYVIDQGDYLFTLQNFINKKFNIESGGRIRWTGDPFNASIDIVANYRTRASLNDLFGTSSTIPTGSEDKQNKSMSNEQKIVVDDRLTMTGMLMKPDVKYDIYLPNSDEETRLKVSNAISSTEDINNQFISLLIQNRFVLSNTMGASAGTSPSPYSNAAGVNASEFLSNQLSHWLSQISNDVDVGVNYRSNRAMKSDEVQVALSTQLFNDRLTINGSVDVATNASVYATDNIVGEFDIDYKLTKNGKFRIKTYNHINNEMLYENSVYTQGLGVFYKEEFNTLGELWRRYWKSVAVKKEEEDVPIVQDPGKELITNPKK